MRIRSLRRDANDDKALRNHIYDNEFDQPMNFFWTAEGSAVPIIGNWRGSSAFLICGGPSLNQIDKEPLKYCYTMALNNAVKACLPEFRPDSWCTVDDPMRMLGSIWLDPKIMKFVPHAHQSKKMWYSIGDKWRPMTDESGRELNVRHMPNVLYYHRNEKFIAKRFLREDTINWGCHADVDDGLGHKGCRSVMLCGIRILYILGFRTIYLLGCDFSMGRRSRYAFDEQRSRGAIKNNNNTYNALQARFAALLPFFEKAGLAVYNCYDKSKLTAFPFISYNEAIDECLSGVCGVTGLLTERTFGMYQKSEDKMKEIKR